MKVFLYTWESNKNCYHPSITVGRIDVGQQENLIPTSQRPWRLNSSLNPVDKNPTQKTKTTKITISRIKIYNWGNILKRHSPSTRLTIECKSGEYRLGSEGVRIQLVFRIKRTLWTQTWTTGSEGGQIVNKVKKIKKLLRKNNYRRNFIRSYKNCL